MAIHGVHDALAESHNRRLIIASPLSITISYLCQLILAVFQTRRNTAYGVLSGTVKGQDSRLSAHPRLLTSQVAKVARLATQSEALTVDST